MAYVKWKAHEVAFSLVEDLTEGAIVTLEVMTPQGTITIMGEPREEGRRLIVSRVYISSDWHRAERHRHPESQGDRAAPDGRIGL